MKIMMALAAAALGFLLLCRQRPGLAQQISGRAKSVRGKLTGRSGDTAPGTGEEFSGSVRDRAQQEARAV